jgi:hypothetical protein
MTTVGTIRIFESDSALLRGISIAVNMDELLWLVGGIAPARQAPEMSAGRPRSS